MKKLISIFLLLVLVGCGQVSKDITVLIYDMKDPYMENYAMHLSTIGIPHYNIEVVDAQNSQIIQNESVNEILKSNPGLLIINPVDRLGVYPIIEKAKEQNVPIIFMNREPLERDLELFNQAYYVGAKAEQSGILQAEIVAELFGNNPNSLNEYDKNEDNIIQVIIFKGEQGHQDAEKRTEYVVSELERLGYQLEILTTEIANWSEDTAYQITNQIIDQYQEQVEVIISNNDAMAIGVIKAFIELGLFEDINQDGVIQKGIEPWFPVIGIDGIDEAVLMLEQGYLYATVYNDNITQADAVIELAKALLNGTPLSEIPYEITNDRYIWIDYTKYVLASEESSESE